MKLNQYRLTAIFKSGREISQEVMATDTAEAMIIFASRSFIQYTITDEDGESRDELVQIMFVPLDKYE